MMEKLNRFLISPLIYKIASLKGTSAYKLKHTEFVSIIKNNNSDLIPADGE